MGHSLGFMEDNSTRLLQEAPIGILTFSSDWKINFVNENFFTFGVLYRIEIPSLTDFNLIENDLFPNNSITNELTDLQKGYSFEKVIKTIKSHDQGIINLIVKGTPLFDNNIFTGGMLIIEDIKVVSDALKERSVKSEHIEKIINRINDFIFITDSGGEIIFSAGRNITLLKKSNKDISKEYIGNVFDPQLPSEFDGYLKKIKENRLSQVHTIELKINERKYVYECKLEPLLNKAGQVEFILIFFIDVSEIVFEKRKIEQRISELKHYQTITETISDALFRTDINGDIILWTNEAELIFGYDNSEISQVNFSELLEPRNPGFWNALIKDIESNDIVKSTLSFHTKNNNRVVLEMTFSQMKDDDGSILAVCTNVTDRILQENKLKSSEEMYRNVFRHSGEYIFIIGDETDFVAANPKLLNFLKIPESDISRKKLAEYLSESDFMTIKRRLEDAERGREETIEIKLQAKEGESIYLFGKFSLLPGNGRKQFAGVFVDVTDKKTEENKLNIFKSLFEASQDGIAVESGGKMVLANDSFAEIFGYRNGKQLINKEILQLTSNDDALKVAEYFQLKEQNKDAPNRFEFLGKKADGSNFYTEIAVSSFEADRKIYIVMVTRDVTERKRAQQAIRESEEKYRNITENIDDFLYTFERTETILRPVFYTTSVEKITGYTQTDLLFDSRLILKIIHPDDFSMVMDKVKNLIRSRIQLSGEFEFRIINKHGNVVWVRNKVNLVRTAPGSVQKIYGLVSDISLRKKAEDDLTKTTENLLKLNETKDRFISIVSHDLRTPFSSILGFTDLLLSDDDLDDNERKQYVKYIRESSLSMLSLVNSLLDWTRLQTGRIKFEPERVSANEIITKSVNALTGSAFQKNINIHSVLGNDFYIFADKNLVMQVFNNLISNAIKFTKPEGNISINAKASSEFRFIEFSVKDDGVGIKEENVSELFSVDTKFTSEGTAGEKGTGLGLSLVKEIVEKHGGTIQVQSEFGSGTEFIFTLPVASANILLVDDSKTDRLLYAKILKHITPEYNIDTASDGREALNKIIQSPPALVITDHLMPEMDGYELVTELLNTEIKGKPPVIVLSSNIDRQTIDDYNQVGIEFVFQKPVNLSDFKKAVEKSLRKALTGS